MKIEVLVTSPHLDRDTCTVQYGQWIRGPELWLPVLSHHRTRGRKSGRVVPFFWFYFIFWMLSRGSLHRVWSRHSYSRLKSQGLFSLVKEMSAWQSPYSNRHWGQGLSLVLSSRCHPPLLGQKHSGCCHFRSRRRSNNGQYSTAGHFRGSVHRHRIIHL